MVWVDVATGAPVLKVFNNGIWQEVGHKEAPTTNNIQANSNKYVNMYRVPDLTPEQITETYNSIVAGHPATITNATGNYHLSVMQADNLSGDLSISIIFLNVMLVTYTIENNIVDIQYKEL